MKVNRLVVVISVMVFLLYSFVFVGCTKDRNEMVANFDEWVGDYEFSEHCDPDQNLFYSISINKENGEYYAEFNIDGFQTLARLKAKVIGNENSIDFIFTSYLPENILEPYNEGDTLLSFEKKDGELYTTWGKIIPMAEHMNPGIYFKKIKST